MRKIIEQIPGPREVDCCWIVNHSILHLFTLPARTLKTSERQSETHALGAQPEL